MNKYNARKTEYNGMLFDSKKEADYCRQLDLLKKATGKDQVVSYQRQIPFKCMVGGKTITTYKLDFLVQYADRTEYIDVKGCKKGCAYQLFKLKKKLVEAIYGIRIDEV